MKATAWAFVWGLISFWCGGCVVGAEGTRSTGAALTADNAMAACEAAEKNCVVVPAAACAGQGMVTTFGGDSESPPSLPIHPDKLDVWIFAGPLAGMTGSYVTTTVNGTIEPAAYACEANSPPLTLTGTW